MQSSNTSAAPSTMPRDHELEWDQAHRRMKENPPSEGRDYLRHARRLLPFLEAIAEVHPISKGVVSGFRAILLFEQDRQENDVRVAAVFLAETDMMCVLLDINNLTAKDHSHRSKSEITGSLSLLEDLLYRIQVDLKKCGNAMDAYYKETRFVKFWKAQEWKEKILSYINLFNEYRASLDQVISLRTASEVHTLSAKLDDILTRVFTPQAEWEKALAEKTRHLGAPISWINDQDTLKRLVSISEQQDIIPSVAQDTPGAIGEGIKSRDSVDALTRFKNATMMDRIKEELSLSLDSLCERNLGVFELKLGIHTQQLQEAIAKSAQYVVRTLSGPHDRLMNEDLRELWKEMNWIFCVDNKLFMSALFEYYLDLFSSNPSGHPNHPHPQEPGPNEKLGEASQYMPPKVEFLSRLGSFNHPDAWTLEYIALHSEKISNAIDRDKSGFIRISEANAFAQQIPQGWTLPQWCAYAAVGWMYECRIYRKRVRQLIFKINEMQRLTFPSGRRHIYLAALFISVMYHGFAFEPKESLSSFKLPSELRTLIKDKILAQDNKVRQRLIALNWTIDDHSTFQLLYGEKPVESYILQCIVLQLENSLDIIQFCTKNHLDPLAWQQFYSQLLFSIGLAGIRIDYLSSRFVQDNKEPSEEFKTFYGGLWHSFWELTDTDNDFSGYTMDILENSLQDASILVDFPIPATDDNDNGGTPTYSTVPPVATMDSKIEDLLALLGLRSEGQDGFPSHSRSCDKCAVDQMKIFQDCYGCLDCEDFDFCPTCFVLPPEEHTVNNHNFSHQMMRIQLDLPMGIREWVVLEGKHDLDKLRQEMDAQARAEKAKDVEAPSGPDTQLPSPPVPHVACGHCAETIDPESTFYKCFGYNCRDYYCCEKCPREPASDESSNHEPWHHLLVLHKDTFKDKVKANPSDSPTSTSKTEKELEPSVNVTEAQVSKLEAQVEATKSVLEDRISQMEAKFNAQLEATKSALEDRMSGMEAKFDAQMAKINLLLIKLTGHLGSQLDSDS